MGYTRRLLWFTSQLPPELLLLTLQTFFQLFAGTRAWLRGMELFSFEGASADRIYEAFADNLMNCDFLTPMGFLQVVASVMRIHKGDIFWGAIPCSSWVFFSR